MVVECTQTLHQKETVKLIKDFFESADNNIFHTTRWGFNITGRLFGATGIKFDKPFMVEVFEGSFTTNSLLKKYPIKASQVMYIFPIRKKYNYYNDTTDYEVKATRVYHHGKVFTDGNNNLRWGEENYFNHECTDTYSTLDDYNKSRQQAIKTLVLVADKENVIETDTRKSVFDKEYKLVHNIYHDYNANKTSRFKLVRKEDSTYYITLRNGRGITCGYLKTYRNEPLDYEPFDNSGYCVVAFRKSLNSRLESYRSYLRVKRVIETDYSQELQTRYNEIIVLKNLVGTSIINSTDRETLDTLYDLMDKVISVVGSHEDIISKLKESRENYEKYKHKPSNFYTRYCYYNTVDDVTEDFKDLDSSIRELRTDLFDNVLQQDIA